jgi:hypothetical protein
MNRNDGRAAIRMLQEMVAAFGSNNGKACAAEHGD